MNFEGPQSIPSSIEKKKTQGEREQWEEEIKDIIEIEDNLAEMQISEELKQKLSLSISRTKEKYKKNVLDVVEKLGKTEREARVMVIDNLKKKIDFVRENEERILRLSRAIESSVVLGEFIALKFEITELLSNARDEYKIEKNEDIFEYLISDELAESIKNQSYSVSERETYLPLVDERETEDGGDGWLRGDGNSESSVVLLDTLHHGEKVFYQKVMIRKMIELFEETPKEKQVESLTNIDFFINAISDSSCNGLNFSYERIKKRDKKDATGNILEKELSIRINGDSAVLIFVPEEDMIYQWGVTEDTEGFDFLTPLNSENPHKIKDIKNGFKLGFGMLEYGERLIGSEGVFNFPSSAQVVMASDGIFDSKNILSGNENTVQKLKNFIEQSRSGGDNNLALYLKKIFSDPKTKLEDDTTILEV